MSLFYLILLCLILGSKKAVGQDDDERWDSENGEDQCYVHQYFNDVRRCTRGYQQIGDKMYWIPGKGERKLTWHQAWLKCRQTGGVLASFDDIGEIYDVANTIYWEGFDVKENFWTDGNDLATQGVFVWFENGLLVEPHFFSPGEPNNLGVERCVHIWTASGQHYYGLNNIECDKKQYYVCQIKVSHMCD